jgi:NAD(P)-dependent dehydrogenase (short-subunit alcohol dehydrogenase family)
MATVLITGCNRGIGLELARQFEARGDEVIGVCRTASDEARALGIRLVEGIDVSDDSSVRRLADELADVSIDVLVNNAGILRHDRFGELDYDAMLEQFRVNALGPLRVTEALSNRLHAGSKVVIITSRVGSIEDNSSGGYFGYRASKTAVNQVGKNLALELEPRKISVAMLHPGMVSTEMTNRNGIDAADAARGLIARIDELTLDESGGFWHAEGYRLPW